MDALFSYGDKQKQMHGTIIKQFTDMRISFISTYTTLLILKRIAERKINTKTTAAESNALQRWQMYLILLGRQILC